MKYQNSYLLEYSQCISNCPEAFCKYAPQRVLSFEFMPEHLQTTASILSVIKLQFSTHSMYSAIFSHLWYHIWHLEAFHSFTIVNWKSLNFSCKQFFFLQTLWYHFFIDQLIRLILFQRHFFYYLACD